MAFQIILQFDNIDLEKKFLGPNNRYIELISDELRIKLNHISGAITIDEAIYRENLELYTKTKRILGTILWLLKIGIHLEERDIIHIIMLFIDSNNDDVIEDRIKRFYQDKKTILNTFESKQIIVKTLAQKLYLDALEFANIIFVTGPAGTGKTYLAVAYAVSCLKKNIIKKIIITRPAVEAGEKLGFLPGDLKEKVDPYLIPIYDALYEFMGKETIDKLIEKGVIEIAPLAYMRGRTLDNAFIILDEAQNTTSNQMKMFITRLGFHSKMVITGDITQVDLPNHTQSGLLESTEILQNIDGIKHIHFTKHDVMRHPLVSKIVERYEEIYDKKTYAVYEGYKFIVVDETEKQILILTMNGDYQEWIRLGMECIDKGMYQKWINKNEAEIEVLKEKI